MTKRKLNNRVDDVRFVPIGRVSGLIKLESEGVDFRRTLQHFNLPHAMVDGELFVSPEAYTRCMYTAVLLMKPRRTVIFNTDVPYMIKGMLFEPHIGAFRVCVKKLLLMLPYKTRLQPSQESDIVYSLLRDYLKLVFVFLNKHRRDWTERPSQVYDVILLVLSAFLRPGETTFTVASGVGKYVKWVSRIVDGARKTDVKDTMLPLTLTYSTIPTRGTMRGQSKDVKTFVRRLVRNDEFAAFKSIVYPESLVAKRRRCNRTFIQSVEFKPQRTKTNKKTSFDEMALVSVLTAMKEGDKPTDTVHDNAAVMGLLHLLDSLLFYHSKEEVQNEHRYKSKLFAAVHDHAKNGTCRGMPLLVPTEEGFSYYENSFLVYTC